MPRRFGLVLVAVMASACGVAERSPTPASSGGAASATSGQPSPGDCPGPEVTLSELIALSEAGPDCFGDNLLTLRGWVWEDRGAYDCVHDEPGATFPPDWLFCAATNHARLTPVSYAPGEPLPGFIRPGDGPFFFAVDPASPAAQVVRPNQWVEIVGRFDDPVTAQCELVRDPLFREPCLSTFVVREARAIEAASSCSGEALLVDCFARVTADSVRVRTEAGLDAPQLVLPPEPDGLPVEARVGLTRGYEHVFIVDGPVQADGLAWYQVAVMNTEFEQSVAPLFVGWVASGDGTDAWLVPEDPCPPAEPVELADLTYGQFDSGWAIYIGCFRDQVFTLRGWFPLLHPDFESQYDVDGSCFAEPAFLVCGPSNKDIRVIEMAYADPRNTERLNFTVEPGAGVELPARGQWIEITGAFDHPASQECGPDAGGILVCRAVFVAAEVSVTE